MRTHRVRTWWRSPVLIACTAGLAVLACVAGVPSARAEGSAAPVQPAPTIALGPHAGSMEQHAAAELRRYLYELSGSAPRVVTVQSTSPDLPGPVIAVGAGGSDNPILADLVASGALPDKAHMPGAEGYVLKTVQYQGAPAIAVLGSDARGTLYGAYRLLEQYGVRFYVGRDVLPHGQSPFAVKQIDLFEQPTVAHRGLLPWHDFLNGPSGYSLADFEHYVDQMAKMRMNTLVLHDYMGGYPGADINEPFISLTCNGTSFHGFLDTSVTNQRWALAPSAAKDLASRSGDYLPYQVLGSDAARDTDAQPDAQANTFRKAQAMLQQTIRYASSEGVDVVLGTDLDLLPRALTDAGCNPLDPKVLRARVDSIMSTYPTLKYVQMYYSESTQITTEDAIKAYQVMRDHLAEKYPGVHLITGSWFLEGRFTDMDSALPKDVIFSTLMPHDMTVRPQWAQVSKNRQAWAVPWMEFDGGLSEPQLAVQRMQQQLPQLRGGGVTGMIGILWRERPAEANVAYLAQDAWQPVGKALDAMEFYRDYAAHTIDLTPDEASTAAEVFSDLEKGGAYGNGFYGYGPTTPEFGGWAFGMASEQTATARATTFGGLADRFAALRPSGAQGQDSLAFWVQFMRWLQGYWTAQHKVPDAAHEAVPRSDNYFLVAAGSPSGEKDLLPDNVYGWYGGATGTYTVAGTVDNDFGYPNAIRSERWSSGTFGYRFPVPQQYDRYRVELYFQEGWFGVVVPGDPTGQRVFDVAINGTTVQKDFDIAKQAGGSLKGVKLSYDVSIPADHTLDISFIPVVSNPKIDIIRAYPIDSSGQPLPATYPPNQPTKAWDDLKHSGVAEALDAYQKTVRDLPGLGGLVSASGGRWMYPDNGATFASYKKIVVGQLPAPPPDRVEGRGTTAGATISWQPYGGKTDGVAGYNVWRAPAGSDDFTKLTLEPVTGTTFTDQADGSYTYAVTTVLTDSTESPRSFEVAVDAGQADRTAPYVLMLPQPSQTVVGEDYSVAATAVDGRAGDAVSATLHYRQIGDPDWQDVAMRRNVRGEPYTFYAAIPGKAVTEDGVEYYVSATDGNNTGYGPAGAPGRPLSLTGTPAAGPRPSPVEDLRVDRDATGNVLNWRPGDKPGFEYRVYRGTTPEFVPGPETYLTYVPGAQTSFRDTTAAQGRRYYYAVVAVSEGERTAPLDQQG